MSKARQITGIDINLDTDGMFWVWVRFDEADKHGFCVRSYHSRYPEKRARLLKRARQMQGLIMGSWYKKQKRVVAIGNQDALGAE